MKDSDPEPDPAVSRVLLAFNFLAWAAVIALTLPIRRNYRAVIQKIQLKELPALTELFMLTPDLTYAVLGALPPLILLIFEISPAEPRHKTKANIVGLIGVVLTFACFALAMRMPIHTLLNNLGNRP